MGYRIGIDTGGTFTDLVVVDPTGRIELFKTPSTPLNPPSAIRTGLDLISERLELPVGELLRRCDMIIHGTTVALNALNRSMGVPDAYPFAISARVREKLELVHRRIGERAASPETPSPRR